MGASFETDKLPKKLSIFEMLIQDKLMIIIFIFSANKT